MSIVWDSKKQMFIVDAYIRCQHCGFDHNTHNANCCGGCGKSLRFSARESLLWANKLNPKGTERWKVYDSHKNRCMDIKDYELMMIKYKRLLQAIEKERLRRDKNGLFVFRNDSFLSELESILKDTI